MKNNMKILFEGWRGFLLIEGRKENAGVMIVKKINDPALRNILETEILSDIITADPTPNKKYIEWAARRMAAVAQRKEDDDYLKVLKNYQDSPEGFHEFNILSPERQELVKSYSDEKRIQAGYYTNIQRLEALREMVIQQLRATGRMIRRSLPLYHKAAERGLMDRNIDKYKDLYDWENDVYRAEREMSEREHLKTIEKEAKENTDYIHDDDDFMIVRPRTSEASCYYGRGTTWCISATRSDNYFKQYTSEGAGFYFVLLKHLDHEDPYKKMALVFRPGEHEPGEVFDAVDDEVGIDALREAVEANIFSAAVKNAYKADIQQMKKEPSVDVRKFITNRAEIAQAAFMGLDDYLDGEPWGDSEWGRRELLQPGDDPGDQMQRKVLGKILNELGLDEGSVDVAFYDDIYEHITDLVSDQFANIVGDRQRVIDGRVYDGTGVAGHWEDNPAGPSYEDFDHILERYGENLGDIFSVHYDRMDIGEWNWEGYIRFDVEREFGEILHHDHSIIEEIITEHLESELRHPDWEVEFDGEDFEIRVYGGHISLEHEEYETGSMNDFEAFVNVMDGAAQDWPETKESITEDFKERGITPGAAIGN